MHLVFHSFPPAVDCRHLVGVLRILQPGLEMLDLDLFLIGERKKQPVLRQASLF